MTKILADLAGRRKAFAAAVACAGALAGAAPAGAATTSLGAVAPAGVVGTACSACTHVQTATEAGAPSYTIPPAGGVITEWSVRGGGTAGATDHVRLRVLRPNPVTGNWTVAADSNEEPLQAGVVRTMPTRMNAAGGDVLGLRLATTGDTPAFHAGGPGDVVGSVLGDPAQQQDTGVLVQMGGRRLNLQARVETDNDRDGFGDDTQDFDDDNDGLSDSREAELGSDPLRADTDGDGAGDDRDVCLVEPDPAQLDNELDGAGNACDGDDDNDGLADDAEEFLGTSSNDHDTDDDGFTDEAEDRLGTDAWRADSDRDRLPDGLESGLTQLVGDPPGLVLGTDPLLFRRDRDPRTKTNPLRRDHDRDRLADGREDRNGNGRRDRRETDPRRRDTDRDGVPDGADRFPLNRRR